MSQGDAAVTGRSAEVSDSETARLLYRWVREGRSFSGRERNCCFLNIGGRFADISGVSGIDFPDDGRGVALTDWDFDGDLDLWLANRNGPQARFARNEAAEGNHFLAIRLVGRTCNRDAIGARVRVELDDAGKRPLLRTLRAGDGFLSQSSKWLHFGLAEAEGVRRVQINWPDGSSQEIRGLQANHWYEITQGDGVAKCRAPKREVRLPPTASPAQPIDGEAAVFLASRIPLPSLRFETLAGEVARVPDQGPRLIHLWASWCLPCVRELREFARHEAELAEGDLEVIALAVDGFAASGDLVGRFDPQTVRSALDNTGFPFRYGRAGSELVEILQIAHDEAFELHRPLQVPASFLIDQQGRLTAIYIGPVSIDRLKEDVNHLPAARHVRRGRSLPFAGRWHGPDARP